jgi:hypothetical protein
MCRGTDILQYVIVMPKVITYSCYVAFQPSRQSGLGFLGVIGYEGLEVIFRKIQHYKIFHDVFLA